MMYLFVDPNVQELTMANNLPGDISYWWKVSPDLNINDVYINRHNRVVHYPPKPGNWATFDTATETWVDMRTPEMRLAELQLKREMSFLPKLEFILRVVAKEYISQAAGLQLLSGQIPDELIGLAELLTGLQTFELQAKLVAASQIDRLDPFIQLVAWYMGMVDSEVDELFGITTN